MRNPNLKIIGEEIDRIKDLMGISKKDSIVVTGLQKLIDENSTLERKSTPIPYDKRVEMIQIALQFLGFSLPKWGVDGKFGPETEISVENFQEENSMEVTGVVTKEVLQKIVEELVNKNFENTDLLNIKKDKTETILDDKNIKSNIVIGDSQTPYVANGSSKFSLISDKGSKRSLWLGGVGLNWLLDAVENHPGSKKVKNIAICIGTNGAFSSKDNIPGLVSELRNKFPRANLFAIQGSWGWGGLKNIKEEKVKKYYQKFKDQGVEVIDPPIGKIEPHGNKPIYKTIGSELDSKSS
jgi:peptidoglycan hydrolase-like protein with peptidoglycan-binding domain